jgi:general secretion pathway protein K
MKSFHRSSGSHESVSICPRRQQGVALVLALLIVALAVTLVAGMFWLQHVQVRALALQ